MLVVGDASKERFIACFVDNLIALFLTFAAVVEVPSTLPVLKGVVLVAVYLGYFIVLEGIWGRTFGKYFQGLVVRYLDGRRGDWKAALIRGALRFIEINPVFFGGILAGLIVINSPRKQRLGDMMAGTVVVSDKLKWGQGDVPQPTDH